MPPFLPSPPPDKANLCSNTIVMNGVVLQISLLLAYRTTDSFEIAVQEPFLIQQPQCRCMPIYWSRMLITVALWKQLPTTVCQLLPQKNSTVPNCLNHQIPYKYMCNSRDSVSPIQ